MASDLRRSPLHLLHRAGQCAADTFHAEIEEAELTPRQLAILIAVAEHEGNSQMVLVERTGVDRSTLSDLVARLQRKGLLQRRRTKEDSRAYAVSLTPAGRRVLQKAEPVARRVDQRLLQSLPEKQRQRFLDALHSVIATLQRT